MDKFLDRLPWIMAIICAFMLGVGTGNWATRRVLQENQSKILSRRAIIAGSEFCSMDGKTWWRAREADGQCYAQDEPRQ